MQTPLVSAIVSTYNSERFIRGCLEDLENQTIASELEIIVVDSGSEQNEGAIVQEFARRFPNIRYIRTSQREGLYEAWNRAVTVARGKYLTNANTDDRHRADAFQTLAQRLESTPEAVLAYGDQIVSFVENEPFDLCRANGGKLRPWPEYTAADLMLRCITGSQPMWRSSVHDEHGLFSTRFRIAGDYEFWMRLAQTGQFVHVAEPLGVRFESSDTLEYANKWQCDMESLEIKKLYLDRAPWRQDRELPARLAPELFIIGYRYIKRRERKHAMPFLLEAWKLDRLNLSYLKTLVLRGWMGVQARLE